ncbi:hypothetical protein B0H67DRAFT_684173 [Lasiosphaeris hirsuta]|uniref:Uncharacterized protein n=1 Tax=Lasiosphaeris hirsuta TaxID=260670 RepID=A0AA40AHW3_9PEZI|nr:hypothetical protein B0H67DRAFT_684173 [Lasiosphaeris hirsuta]
MGQADEHEPIAIIGSGCRFPGQSTSPSKLWDLLHSPRDVSSKIDRFAAESFYHSNGHHSGSSNVLHSYLLAEDTRSFDAQFFNIQGGEAGSIDPQQRLLMEVIYEALEAGGQKMEHLSGTPTGVYVGVMCNDFSQITYADIQNVPKYAATGTALSIMSNRISYFFNWTGPSMTIDTACSSSLVAVHQAVQLLRSGQSRLAVAAGSNLIFTPTNYIAESNVNMLSPTGRSRMWDAHADGYARGEGVGCVVLKRLSDAIADGDAIECIVRETGINQDGRTPGITMPSSSSQASLIRQTYARAGLNPLLQTDRCQYFEAHGTGTKAGDPQEARAIHEAFHGQQDSPTERDGNDVLYVGSVKTVIGHTEGTAGIAGLIKASLSVQHGIIPANMLFTELNPDIEPYYGFLQIPTAPKPWPALPPGVPRRASVNSFGFGGANAHAIVESYTPGASPVGAGRSSASAIPLTLSANSEKALAAQVKTHLEFLEQRGEDVNVRDAAWTLSHRSVLAHRVSVAAVNVNDLKQQLSSLLDAKKNDNKDIGVRPSLKTSKILGIFTGQGAQWPQMGYQLLQSSQSAAATIRALDASLQALPKPDRPEWSLQDELSKSGKESRVMQAEFSQPLCTAVQIILVDALRAVGVNFDAVVGHSSGEIGAAYASGYLSAWDAIRVAYYRGRLAHLAPTNGAMLAAGTSLEDATDLCSLPVFRGRISVAASNSSASVTLSGDGKAIERALLVLEDEGKFVRMLKVDKAYHSHHMEPCAEPYMEAMLSHVRVQVQEPLSSCKWFSSVLGGEEMTPNIASELTGPYWRDNLLKTVLFSQALEAALEDLGSSPGLVVEVGPHPALKGPASGVIEETCGAGVPYTGVLARGKNDVQALSAGIGAVWSNMASPSFKLDFKQLDALFADGGDDDKPLFLKSLPTYTWDHDKIHFTESRATKALLSRPSGHHELLGVRLEGREKELRWRNFIKPTEMPWLRGHQVQGQMVFPGAGFASIAFEAARALVDGISDIALVEVLDLRVSRAMALSEDDAGVETLVTLSNVSHDIQGQVISADYECTVFPNSGSALFTASTARLRLELAGTSEGGHQGVTLLPPRQRSGLDMSPVNMDHFYSSLATLGYNYSDMFRGITALERTTDMSSGVIHIDADDGYRPGFILHPAPLDVAFQTVFGALGSPGDGRLWTTLVPTLMTRIRINPQACTAAGAGLGSDLPFDAAISVSASEGVSGDVDIFDSNGNSLIQIEGLQLSPLTSLTAQDDRQMFSQTEWGAVEPDATKGFSKWVIKDEEEKGHMYFIERACFFYMKRLHDAITQEERDACDWHRGKYLAWVADMVSEVAEGRHPIIAQEWMHDTWEVIEPMLESFVRKLEDFRILMVVGDNLIPWVRDEISFLEMYRESNTLEHVYKNTIGFPEYNAYLGGLVEQLSHRFRQMDILEVGAGTGSATEAIMRRIRDNYASFTYTDISAGFFPEAQDIFKEQAEKFVYSTLDVEKDPMQQGYSAHSYDLVVASNVLHATRSLETTLKNVRKLLKPGGYLVILEITDLDPLRPTFFFGTLPGWWVGEADGRPHHPLVTQQTWDGLLKKTGFSGLDTATPPSGEFIAPQSIMLSQAVDAQMQLVRQPRAPEAKVALDHVLIIGGRSMKTFQLQEELLGLLEPLAKNVACVERFDQLEDSHFTDKQVVISLTELDEPIFDPFSPAKWKALQVLTEKARNIVWINQGGLSGKQPYANMMVGVARCLTAEKPGLRFQTLDFDMEVSPDPDTIADAVVRMHISDAWGSSTQPYSPTWTLEREVRISADGQATIPRYIASEELDARYNSSHRTVRKEVALRGAAPIAVNPTGEAVYELEEVVSAEKAEAAVSPVQPALVEIKVERSSLMAPSLRSVGALYLVHGTISTGKKVLGFSTSNASVVSVPAGWTVPCSIKDLDPTTLILEAVAACWAREITEAATPGTSILVHEPPTRAFARALGEAAAARGASVRFTTCKRDLASDAMFTYVHPSRNGRSISRLFLKDMSTFVDMSGHGGDAGGMAARIQRQLPVTCQIVDSGTFMNTEAHVRPSAAPTDARIPDVLEQITLHLSKRTAASEEGRLDNSSLLETVSIAALPGRDLPPPRQPASHIAVLDWTTDGAVPARVWPAEDLVRFHHDKTYWLVGLAGALGQSLCWWMVQRGARNIVITSRNPRVSEAWMGRVVSEGAKVSLLSCDVTDRRSVMKTYQTIVKTMPPIAGVCNGAMILNDGIIAQMSHEKFDQTLRPKVDGTRFLDEIFDKPNLDFFIVFSSLAYVTGNIGQSSYAAANAFMASVAQGRRARGLAGSVMNLAGIFGIGYITRTDSGILERLAKMGYSNVSEWDFLQFFAEAVMAGKPDGAGRHHEISSSLRPYDPELDANPPSWLPIPRFSYYRRTKVQTGGGDDGQKASVRAQLKQQTTTEGVYQVVTAGLSATLYKQLGLAPEDNTIQPHTRLVDLGIDSLVAVDMRFWFTKELDLDMPVLKLLGGASVEEMVADIMERLSPELTPNVNKGEGATASPPVDDVKPAAAVPTILAADGAQISSDESSRVSSSESGPSSTKGDADHDGLLSPSSSVTPPESEAAFEGDVKEPEAELVFQSKQPMGYPSLQFWFVLQHLHTPSAFNCSFRIAFKGRLDVERMRQAAELLGQRHDSLRTAFFDDPSRDHEPTQAVLPPSASPLRLEVLRVSGLQDAIDFTDHVQFRHVFDLSRGEVVRMALLSVDQESHYLVIGLHHIAMDGYSFDVFLRELVALYEGRQLDPVQMQWNDLVAEQRLAITTGSMKKEVDFWKKTLGVLPEPLPMLPFAKVPTRMPVTHFVYEEVPIVVLDEATVRAIRERCRGLQVTRFHFFMTVLRTMLFGLTSASDVDELCIGMIDANRTDTRATSLIGLMVNMLPMKFSRKPAQSFTQACHEVRDMAYAALAHSRLPFKAMLDQLAVPRSTYCSPIFQVALDYLPHKFETPEGLGTPTDEVKTYLSYGMTDLVLDINDISATEIHFRWRAQTDLYSKEAVQTMMDMYVKLVKRFASSGADCKMPTEKIRGGLQLYDQVRIQDAVKTSLGPAMTLSWAPTASHVIESLCVKQPDAIALKDDSTVLSYAQMSQRVGRIEQALLSSGSRHERVACYQLPTVDWVCTLLAVWRIGAAYVPLDSRLPEARIASLLELSRPSAVLCRPETFDAAKAMVGSSDAIVVLDVSDLPPPPLPPTLSGDEEEPASSATTKATPESPAAILFTSGSSGTPKGVELRHESLSNLAQGTIARHFHGADAAPLVVLQQSAASFDMNLGQMVLGLCTGGTVVVVPREKRGDPQEVCKTIRDEGVSFILATPSEVAEWFRFGSAELGAAEHLRYFFVGGEALQPSLRASFFKHLANNGKLVNVYGPTEALLWCTTAEIDYNDCDAAGQTIPLGRPMPNYGVFVVDKDMKPLPRGVTGEVVITGVSVASGYFGQPALTKAAFIPDTLTPPGSFPVRSASATPLMYRTGDNGRFGPDGQLYYQGRIAGDSQVKINGIRIEIQEVESVILEHAQGTLSAAVVSARRNPDFLVGHVEFAAHGTHGLAQASPEQQSQFLASLVARLPLPRYMCPALLVPLERMPVNGHGKVDRRAIQALPLPATRGSHESAAGLSETEKALWDIWVRVLPEECTSAVAVGPDTDFFSLGGGSYALVLVSRFVRETFGVTVPVMQLFDSFTLRGMAAKVDAAVSVALIDWHVETALEQGLEQVVGSHTKPGRGEEEDRAGATVVLTGATGYLGRNLLKTLIASPAIDKIYCVGARSADRLPRDDAESDKVTLFPGDIGAPLLGLSAETFDRIAREADVIIHSGANRSFWDYYQTLRPSNFVSTKTLVSMAAVGRTPLHFISSGGLVTDSLQDDAELAATAGSATALGTPPTDGSNGYLATKWASEAYLEKAGRQLGLPVHIHRVVGAPATAAESETAPELEELIAEFRDVVLSLKAVPQPQGWRGSFDVVRTSGLCRALVEDFVLSAVAPLGTGGRGDADQSPRYVHHPSDVHLRIEDVVGALGAAAAGGDLESLPPHVWVGKAKAAGIDWHFSGQDFGAAGAEGFELRR